MALVISFSGGKDSTAMAKYLIDRYAHRVSAVYFVMSDTGFEHLLHVDAISWSHRIVGMLGHDLHVVKHPNKNFFDLIRHRQKFPSPRFRFCTSDGKRQPIDKFIRSLPHKVVINAMGMRSEESRNRAKMPRLKRNKRLCTRSRTVWDWLPIKDWSLDRVLGFLDENRLPLHPIYVWAGGYLKRFSCRVCIFMTDAEIRSVYEHDREAFTMVADLEKEIGFTMKIGESLPQILAKGERVRNPVSAEGEMEEREVVCVF